LSYSIVVTKGKQQTFNKELYQRAVQEKQQRNQGTVHNSTKEIPRNQYFEKFKWIISSRTYTVISEESRTQGNREA
jgi:predicted ribosome quality control (RQC) complex YloA/Tae2 family protein